MNGIKDDHQPNRTSNSLVDQHDSGSSRSDNGDKERDSASNYELISRTSTNAISPIENPPHAEVSGLGGWLAFVQLVLIVTLASNIIQLFTYTIPSFQPDAWNQLTKPSSEYYHPKRQSALLFDCAATLAVIAYVSYILFPFYRRRRSTPMLMIFLFAGSIVIGIVRYWIAQDIPVVPDAPDLTGKDLRQTVISSAIWIWYFAVSKRVRNTFIR
ncbi:DUF2569 domain-containing protein [Paenibacillus kobensis]|uniref:DUF2569 domain-containing protein n=1 Tax=Paenibacillus kobensis TaxID=59841 RepID=UPI000FDAFB90|nr:DUF2569 domain-containing protein [Paenibacillus kobensis]